MHQPVLPLRYLAHVAISSDSILNMCLFSSCRSMLPSEAAAAQAQVSSLLTRSPRSSSWHRVEKDVWAAADGGVGSSDSEEEAALFGATSAVPMSGAAMRKAYQVLEKPPLGQQGQVVHDSSDDDDD